MKKEEWGGAYSKDKYAVTQWLVLIGILTLFRSPSHSIIS